MGRISYFIIALLLLAVNCEAATVIGAAKFTSYSTHRQGEIAAIQGDSRWTDSRPASDVSAWAKSGTKPTYTYSEVGAEASGAVSTHSATTTGVHGAGANSFIYSNDSRLTDARTPTAHNQADSTITFTDITTGNASTSNHGYLPKLGGGTTNFLRADGTWSAPGGGGGVGTMTELTATWASSATANATGIVGTADVPMTSPTYGASAPFSFRCVIATTRPSTTNGPRYGVAASVGSVTRISMQGHVGLAGTAPARTQNIQELHAAMTTNCAANCTSAITASTLAEVMLDIFEGQGQMNASGTISLYMAPSASAANTAQIGSYCIWY